MSESILYITDVAVKIIIRRLSVQNSVESQLGTIAGALALGRSEIASWLAPLTMPLFACS